LTIAGFVFGKAAINAALKMLAEFTMQIAEKEKAPAEPRPLRVCLTDQSLTIQMSHRPLIALGLLSAF